MMRARHSGGAIAVALAVVFTGCGSKDPAPVIAAKKFAAAAQSGDVDRVLELTESASLEHLNQVAERASDQVGGRRVIEPREMLQVVDVDPSFQIAEAAVVGGDGVETAVVALTGADRTIHEITLVNEEGDWRVRVPVPSQQPVEEP